MAKILAQAAWFFGGVSLGGVGLAVLLGEPTLQNVWAAIPVAVVVLAGLLLLGAVWPDE